MNVDDGIGAIQHTQIYIYICVFLCDRYVPNICELNEFPYVEFSGRRYERMRALVPKDRLAEKMPT